MTPPRPWLMPLLLWLVCAGPGRAGSLESAFQARAMIGDGLWSRVLRIENDRPGGDSRYPAEFHALVMAVEDMLWLYTEFDGTQSISIHAGQLEGDKADLGPLLRAVEPGLGRFEDVTGRPPEGLPDREPEHACFLAAVARWEELRREAKPPTRARLLAFYAETRRQGHMVLEYWRDGRRYLFDPGHPAKDREIPLRLAEDPLKMVRSFFRPDDPNRPVRARHLDLGQA